MTCIIRIRDHSEILSCQLQSIDAVGSCLWSWGPPLDILRIKSWPAQPELQARVVFISSAFVIFLSTAMGKHQEQTIKHHQTVSNDALQLSGQLCGQAKIAELGMAALCFGEKNVRPKSRGIKEHQDQGPLGGHISSG